MAEQLWALRTQAYVVQVAVHPFSDAHSPDGAVKHVDLWRGGLSLCVMCNRMEYLCATYCWVEALTGQKPDKRNDFFCCIH